MFWAVFSSGQKHSQLPALIYVTQTLITQPWITQSQNELHSQLHKLRMSYTKSKYGLNRASKASNILCPITFSYQDDFRYILCFGHDLKSWGHAEIGQNLQMYSALASLHGLSRPHHPSNFSFWRHEEHFFKISRKYRQKSEFLASKFISFNQAH